MTITHTAQAQTRENVTVSVYNLENIEDIEPRWPHLSREEKRQALTQIEPESEIESANTTTIGLDEYRALNLDQTRDVNDSPDEIALGDGGGEPEYENTELNNELGRVTIDEYDVSGTSIILNSFVPEVEITEDDDGNNPNLVELGVVSEEGRLFNHALFNSIEKTPQRALQVEVVLTFETADNENDT